MLQGLTLDIEKGNLLRLGRDGYILAACHGTRYTTCRAEAGEGHKPAMVPGTQPAEAGYWVRVGATACHGSRYTT